MLKNFLLISSIAFAINANASVSSVDDAYKYKNISSVDYDDDEDEYKIHQC